MADVEEWKAIPGWPYEASSLGRIRRSETIRNYKAGRLLKPQLTKRGYLQVVLTRRPGSYQPFRVHRLVILAFKGWPPDEAYEVAHSDGSRTNNRPENLRWATRTANHRDRDRHGRTAWGERSGQSKLTADQVLEARKLRRQGWTYKAIGELFGVHLTTIAYAVTGRNWNRLEESPDVRC